jgi:hypothetical protein
VRGKYWRAESGNQKTASMVTGKRIGKPLSGLLKNFKGMYKIGSKY